MTKYLFPNWSAINKSIGAGEITELRKEQQEIEKKIQDKIDAYYKAKRMAEIASRVKALRDLPEDAEVHYIGRSTDIKFGAKGRKVFTARNGSKRMQVEFDGKLWNCYYTNLQIEAPTESQLSSNNITNRLNNFFTNHPL